MRELIDKLNYHTKLYDAGKPEISDREWNYAKRMKELCEEYIVIFNEIEEDEVNFEDE